MRLYRIAASLLVVLLLSGCEAVFVQQPMGDEAVVLDASLWQGTWLNEEIVLMTTVLNAEQGQLQAAWIERYQDGAKFDSVSGFIRQSGDRMYLNMQHVEEEAAEATDTDAAASANRTAEPAENDAGAGKQKPVEFLWARVENDGKRVLLWWPNIETLRAAVREGRIPGTVGADEDVHLGALSEQHLQQINDPAANLLQWTEPVVFLRVGD